MTIDTRVTPADLRKLAKYVEDTKDEIIRILTRISSYKSVVEEINRSIDTLNGAQDELADLEGFQVRKAAVYLPPNVLLFSYILYIAVPSVFVKEIYFRPSVRARDESFALHQHLTRGLRLPAFLSYDSRRVFWQENVSSADFIVFNGRCANALDVGKRVTPKQLFLYFGTGVNPFVVGKDVEISVAVEDLVRIRMHNSGQDCLCPDLILIPRSIRGQFLDSLTEKVGNLKYGSLYEKDADFSTMSYPDTAEFAKDYLRERKRDIVFGGEVVVLDRFIEPTILSAELSSIREIPEFFSPIFNVGIFDTLAEVNNLLHSSKYKGKEMGVMLYTAPEMESLFIQKHMIAENRTLLEISDGNKPFGGSGICASHVRFHGKLHKRPLLLSKEVKRFLLKRSRYDNK